jgi:hypothetical protein
MGKRVFLLVVAFLAAFFTLAGARASDHRINLTYPGWALSLDRHPPRLAAPQIEDGAQESRTLSLRVSGAHLLSDTGWRVPLSDSAFLALEATFTTKHINPVHPGLTRPAFQAGVGLGLEF